MRQLDQPDYEETLESATGWLARRDYSEHELREKLRAHGSTAATLEAVVQRLREGGFVDDLQLATRLVEQSAGTKGKRRIRLELEKRGVAEEASNSALSALSDELEIDQAKRMLQERFAGSSDAGRAARLLARLGFEEEVVQTAIEEHFELLDS